MLWVLLSVIVTSCQPTGGDATDTTPAAVQKPASENTSDDGQTQPSQLYSVGFTAAGHPFKGNPDASVVIEEYSSYQCPYCGRFFAETYTELMTRYVETGQVMYVFNDFPLSSQPQSPKAAEAANCAGEVDGAQAYWEMHDRLFKGQQEWSGQSDAVNIFKGYAAALGIEQAAFDDCLDSGRTAAHVESDSREGTSRGVRGTPSFFINGQVLVGAQPFSAFSAVIDGALAGEPVTAQANAQPSDLEALAPTPAAFAFEQGASDDTLLALGDPNAPVTLVEFTDYQCPYCAQHFAQTWATLKQQYIDAGRVYYVFRDFPLTQIHPQAPEAHAAARCAREVGGDEAYWQMHDRLFEFQDEWAGNSQHVSVFKRFAAELELDQSAFDACLDGHRTTSTVQADVREGFAYGVSGTPTFFIDGYPFSGALPIEFFDQAITLAENGQLRQAIAEAIARAQAEQQAQQQPRPTLAPADVPLGDAPVRGDVKAPITIVEYSDYQCPYCSRHFEQTWPQLLENYVETGQVRYVFKDFPLTSIHPQALKAAEAARCAREVGGDDMYWQMHDWLFAGQDQWSNNSDHAAVFKSYAGRLGLDQTAFDACLDSGRYEELVMADLREGAGFGVSGTPAFFINGQPLSGAQPYEVFVQMIEAELAGK
jgi:protein-disulfide isomerase